MNEKDLVLQDAGELSTKHILVTEYGVEFDNDERPTIEEWFDVVSKVQKFHGMMQFYLGDLMVYADSPVTGWGESKYADLIEATGYSEDALKHFTVVARRFSTAFRRELFEKQVATSPLVSYNHFREVAPLDDEHAMYFLQQVAEGRWTVKKLREEIAKMRGKAVVDVDEDEEIVEKPVTFSQRAKLLYSSAVDVLKYEDAESIRVQVVKNGKVVWEGIEDVEA